MCDFGFSSDFFCQWERRCSKTFLRKRTTRPLKTKNFRDGNFFILFFRKLEFIAKLDFYRDTWFRSRNMISKQKLELFCQKLFKWDGETWEPCLSGAAVTFGMASQKGLRKIFGESCRNQSANRLRGCTDAQIQPVQLLYVRRHLTKPTQVVPTRVVKNELLKKYICSVLPTGRESDSFPSRRGR